MASYLRRCISMGESMITRPGPSNPQDFRYASPGNPYGDFDNVFFMADTQTWWVKIWLPLQKIWPTQDSIDQAALDNLDLQIAMAKVSGRGIILSVHHDLPTWINGSPTGNSRELPAGVLSSQGHNWATVLYLFAARYSKRMSGSSWNFVGDPRG